MSDLAPEKAQPPPTPALKAPPALRRRLLWGVAALWLAVVLLGLLVPWLRQRAQQAAQAQAGLIAQSLENPGTLLLDPAVPAGVLVVTLVPAAPGLVLTQPATIHVDDRSYDWTPEARGRFHDLVAGRPYPITVTGPYTVEPIAVTLPANGSGARVAVRAIQLDPARVAGVDYALDQTPEKRLEVDLTRPDVLLVLWFQGYTIVSEFSLPRGEPSPASGQPLYPALVARLALEWKWQGQHTDPSDRHFDRAIIRALPGTPFDELLAVSASILVQTRLFHFEGALRTVPAFELSVQPPRPPLPAFVLDGPESEPRGPGPQVQLGPIEVSGAPPRPYLERLVRRRLDGVQRCYEVGLGWNPRLAGRVAVRFVIEAGATAPATGKNGGSDLADAATAECIVSAMNGIDLRPPESGTVTIVVPFLLSPDRNRH